MRLLLWNVLLLAAVTTSVYCRPCVKYAKKGACKQDLCPDGAEWSYLPLTGKCYKIIHEVTSFEAHVQCGLSGGTLASIHSEEENDFVKDLAVASRATRVLLGLFETKEGRHWQWSDSSAVNYAPWASGEPNDFLSDEDCAELHMSRTWGAGYYGKWNDVSCTWPYSAVCQMIPNHQF